MEAIQIRDGPLMGCACPLENSIDSTSREIDDRRLSYRRLAGGALTAADPVGVEENREGRKFSIQQVG